MEPIEAHPNEAPKPSTSHEEHKDPEPATEVHEFTKPSESHITPASNPDSVDTGIPENQIKSDPVPEVSHLTASTSPQPDLSHVVVPEVPKSSEAPVPLIESKHEFMVEASPASDLEKPAAVEEPESNPEEAKEEIMISQVPEAKTELQMQEVPEKPENPENPENPGEAAVVSDVEALTKQLEDSALLNDQEIPPAPVLFREPSSSDPEAPDSQHTYFQELGTYRVQMSDWVADSISDYIYDDSPLSSDGVKRINREIKALTKALPCEPSGAVFINIDSSNMSRMKVLISGTEDTPYEHGLYLFDIKLDQSYPSTPPKMTIKTTGDGSLRFNPNLYDSGYVCLSIINTWGGDPEEMWNPSYSTLMQVFLSIQALVMNNDVIQKEPGYEGYETNSQENRDYVTIVKYGNLKYAMIDMIKNPPNGFKDIVHKHFALKKEKILESATKWLGQLEGVGGGFGDCIVSSHNGSTIELLSATPASSVFEALVNELKEELDKLPAV